MAAILSNVLPRVCGLDMQISTYLAFLQVDLRFKERNFFYQPRSHEFDGRMGTVEVINENSYRWFTIVPYSKDVISIPPPNSRNLVQGLQKLLSELSHEQVCI